MASAATVRTALATRLRSIQGLTVHPRVPDYGQLNPPCAVIQPARFEPEQSFGRGDLTRWDFEIMVIVPGQGGRDNAQARLDPYTATSSTGGIFGAIAADRTLGGVVDDTFVKGVGEYGDVEITQDVMMAGFTVNVECWTT